MGAGMKEKDYYWVYMLECENGHFYTGFTQDLERRSREHVRGTGWCSYTRSLGPSGWPGAGRFTEGGGTP